MIDVQGIIRQGTRHGHGRPVVFATRFEMSELIWRHLVTEGAIHGFVADRAPSGSDAAPHLAGWWIDRRQEHWFLRSSAADTIMLLGFAGQEELGLAMLFEARLKGFRRILILTNDAEIEREIDVGATLYARIAAADRGRVVPTLSFDDAFDEFYARMGDLMRLPQESFDPNRILLIGGTLGPSGAERQLAYTARELARRTGREIHLAASYLAGEFSFYRPTVEAAGVTVHLVPDRDDSYESKAIADIRAYLQRYRLLHFENVIYRVFLYAVMIRRLRPGLIHTWLDYCNVLAGTAAEMTGVPALLLSGRSVAPDNFPAFYEPYARAGYRALLRRRDVPFLNNSRAGAVDYARFLDLPPGRIDVVNNGFEFPPMTAPVAAARAAARQPVIVGSILRFSEEKRPDLFIEMARIVHAAHPEVRFTVHGNGVMLEEMRDFVRAEKLDGFIALPGLAADPWAALREMDVFVLTSRIEGLPNVLVEAQASGVPVVSTDVGGVGETLIQGETGFAVVSDRPEALAAAVSRLVADPELRSRMSLRAASHAREAFGVDRMVDRTLALYAQAEAAASRRQGPA